MSLRVLVHRQSCSSESHGAFLTTSGNLLQWVALSGGNEDWSTTSFDCVKKTRKRHAVREMEVGPSKPPCRGRFQTAISCCGPMTAVVNVMVKRRDSDHVMCG